MPEIKVENEPWLGLVILADTKHPMSPPDYYNVAYPEHGYYALARADEWHSELKDVTIWRGPRRQDEVVPKSRMVEEDCRTVLVDEHGFYTCPPILEDLEEDVKEESEKLLEEMANERAAESFSYADQEDAHEKYGDEIFITAEFGDAVAVNGELTFGRKDRKPPRNYALTDMGGYVPGGSEEEMDKERLAEDISMTLTKKLKRPIYEEAVQLILDKLYPKDYIMWQSDSGHVEVWASKRAIRKYEADEEREEREREERYQRMQKEDRQRIERLQELAKKERAEKIKRGGFPGPKDWSPRGRLPGDR